MKTKSPLVFGMLIVFLLSCLIPGASQPLPTPVDASLLPTIVVWTAKAAMTQTAVANAPAVEATSTILTTETAVDQTPISNPFVEPSPLPPGVNETSLEVLPDGSAKFTHITAGYEVTFPTGWIAMRPNSEEFNATLAGAGKNDMLKDQMDYDAANYDAEFDQLYAYILRPDLQKDVMFGFSKTKWDPDDRAPLNSTTMGDLTREIETSGDLPGFRVDTAQTYENRNGVILIELGGQYLLYGGDGSPIPVYITFAYFKPTDQSLARLSVTYLNDFRPDILPDITTVINSIKLTGVTP